MQQSYESVGEDYLRLREVVIKIVAVVKFGVRVGGGNGTS